MRLLILLIVLSLSIVSVGQQTFELNLPSPCANCFVQGDTLAAEACESYQSPSGKYVWEESGFYHDTLSFDGECDTVLGIDLKIPDLNTTIVNQGDSLISNASSVAFQWIDCNTGETISGATDSIFSPIESGDYAVVVTKNGCSDTSDCQNVIISGLGNAVNNQVSIYPNPTEGQVIVKLKREADIISAILYNPEGKQVLSKEYSNASQFTIQFPETKGIYTLQLRVNEGKSSSFNIIHQ